MQRPIVQICEYFPSYNLDNIIFAFADFRQGLGAYSIFLTFLILFVAFTNLQEITDTRLYSCEMPLFLLSSTDRLLVREGLIPGS